MSIVPNLLVVYYLPYFGSSFSAARVMLLSVDVLRLGRHSLTYLHYHDGRLLL